MAGRTPAAGAAVRAAATGATGFEVAVDGVVVDVTVGDVVVGDVVVGAAAREGRANVDVVVAGSSSSPPPASAASSGLGSMLETITERQARPRAPSSRRIFSA